MVNRKLKALRIMYNDKQQDIANYLQISITTYNKKENGERTFSLNEAYKISKRYNASIEDIFFNKVDVI